jgi:transposase
MTNTTTSWVGIDAHADKLRVAVLRDGSTAQFEEWDVIPDQRGIARLIRKFKAEPGRVRCVYEAGPTGYDLQRKLKAAGIDCEIAAPSLIPVRVGDRVKTDRRDARKLARLYRAGELQMIHVPEEDQEALRDLIRAREDVLEDVQRERNRLSRFLLRHGYRYRDGKSWTARHWQWLRRLDLGDENLRVVLAQYRLRVERSLEQLQEFNKRIEEIAEQADYKSRAGRLMTLRGVSTLTAMTIIAEVGDLRRFGKAGQFMAWTGLIPSESSSGKRRRQGSITKTGNAHLRRVLVEAAWQYRHCRSAGKILRRRRRSQAVDTVQIAERAEQRLGKKYYRLVHGKGKKSGIAVVAVARELAGFIWAIGQTPDRD